MLDTSGFDLWADGYDASVNLADEADVYPFAGYKAVLAHIYATVMAVPFARVLDIGFGTGVLTKRLYDGGCDVSGFDFSQRMIEIAKEKMPKANLIQHDFAEGFPKAFVKGEFDFVISTYALHHITEEEKLAFIKTLVKKLKPAGALLIGDVSFETREEHDACRQKSGAGWDEDECYTVFEEFKRVYPAAKFHKMSYCAGVIEVRP